MTKNQDFKKTTKVKSFERQWAKGVVPVRWTDDYASVAALLNWSVGIDLEKMNADLKDSIATRPPKVDAGANLDSDVDDGN